jgi:hypothetical protein
MSSWVQRTKNAWRHDYFIDAIAVVLSGGWGSHIGSCRPTSEEDDVVKAAFRSRRGSALVLA